MRSIKLNDHLVVELPEGAFDVSISVANTVSYIDYSKGEFRHYWAQKLPPNHTYTLIGKCSDLTEEQAAGMVDKVGYYKLRGFNDYTNYKHYYDTAVNSLKSLLRSHSLNPDTSVILKID